MGLWLNIFCGEQTGDILLSVDDFFETLDLAELEIEAGGIDMFDLKKTREAITIEIAPPLSPPFHNTWCALVYGIEDGDSIGWDRYAKPEVDRHIEDALEKLISCDLDAALQNTLHNRLAASVELISTRLPNSSVNGIAFPLAREMALWIATLRAGVVQFDETQWYVPEFKT